MKFLKLIISSFWTALIILGFACSGKKDNSSVNSYNYIPDDQKLYDTIVRLDSIFFDAYNTCDVNLDKYASFYSDSIEFYHDKGGLMTSKQDIVEATKKNICGKVTRELVSGSIEVYPIYNYGAVETGLHKFHNHEEKQPGPPRISKFILLWRNQNNQWKITRVISLH